MAEELVRLTNQNDDMEEKVKEIPKLKVQLKVSVRNLEHSPFINYPNRLSSEGSAGAHPSCHWARAGHLPWTGLSHIHIEKPFTPMGNLESPINQHTPGE